MFESIPSPSWVLKPEKPRPPTSNPAILSLEVLIDAQPKLKGAEDEALGTDLSGTVALALAQDLPIEAVVVQFFGAKSRDPTDPSVFSSSSSSPPSYIQSPLPPSTGKSSGAPVVFETRDAQLVHVATNQVWSPSSGNRGVLRAGAHDLRFLFKLPGALPATEPNRVRYVLRVTLLRHDEPVAELVEEVRVRRLINGDDDEDEEGKGLPSYHGDEIWGNDESLPPGYTDVWKGKEKPPTN